MLKDNSQLKLSLSPYQGIYETAIPANHLLRRIKENRIEGAMNINRVCLIPITAEKPIDRRKKPKKNDNTLCDKERKS